MSASLSAPGTERPTTRAEFPPAFRFLFQPAPYKVAYGGRGSAKSWAYARRYLLKAYVEPQTRVLCARELQKSIDESVHHLLAEQIALLGLADWFTVQNTSIRSHNGAEFIFAGVRNNVTAIKSMEGLTDIWVEEAEKVSDTSWEVLIPTLFRRDGCELGITFNPDDEKDPTYQRFVISPPPGAVVRKVSWRDNPWFPEGLRREKDYLARTDPGAYAHVWEGECRKRSDALVLNGKWIIDAFEPEKGWHGPYQGADWGFVDPTTLVRCWIHGTRLYVSHEAYAVGCDSDRVPTLFDTVPDARKYVTYGDNARPETVSYLQRHGYPRLMSVEKWQGSVEDGVAFLRQFEQIVIHPRCRHVIDEAQHYSYKVDRLNPKLVLPEIVDASNHTIDALRYALQPLIRAPKTGFLTYMQQQVEAMNQRKAAEAAGSSQ